VEYDRFLQRGLEFMQQRVLHLNVTELGQVRPTTKSQRLDRAYGEESACTRFGTAAPAEEPASTTGEQRRLLWQPGSASSAPRELQIETRGGEDMEFEVAKHDLGFRIGIDCRKRRPQKMEELPVLLVLYRKAVA
jgi:hypothetical protein